MVVIDVNKLVCENAEKSYADMTQRHYGLASCCDDMSENDYKENILMIDLVKSGYSCEPINCPCP